MQRGVDFPAIRAGNQHNLLDQHPQSRRCLGPFVGLGEGSGQRRDLLRIDRRGARQQVRRVLGNVGKLLGQFGLAGFQHIHLALHAWVEHAFLDRLNDAPDLLLDLHQFGFPGVAVRTAFPVQPVRFLGIGAHRFRRDLGCHHPFLETGEDPPLQVFAQDGAIVGAGALGHMRRAGETIRATDGEGATAAAAEDQTREQGFRPMGAVQAVLLVVLADAFGDIGISGRVVGLPRLDRLPEVFVDDAQIGNVLDDPFRFRVEPRDALSGRRVFEIAQPVPDQAADIEFVVQDARAALRMAMDGGVVPEPTFGTGHAFLVQRLGDNARADAFGIIAEDAPHDIGLGVVDLAVAPDRVAA